jgi:citrate lyase beta subunit
VQDFGERFCLTLLTRDPALAAAADSAGVDRVGLDFERLDKAARQAGHDTRLSDHSLDDLAAIARCLTRADLFLRIDPLNPQTERDIEEALARGVKVLMLPFFRTAAEVDTFARLVDRRARAVILLETAPAALRVREIVRVPGIDEVMFGLNDLRLAFGVASHFEVLASPLIDALAAEVHAAGLALSLGGVARVDDTALPIAPDLVFAQYPRLGARGAWLSRAFVGASSEDLAASVAALRRRLTHWALASPQAREEARAALAKAAAP